MVPTPHQTDPDEMLLDILSDDEMAPPKPTRVEEMLGARKQERACKDNTYMHNLEAGNRQLSKDNPDLRGKAKALHQDVNRLRTDRNKYKSLWKGVVGRYQKFASDLGTSEKKSRAGLEKKLATAKKKLAAEKKKMEKWKRKEISRDHDLANDTDLAHTLSQAAIEDLEEAALQPQPKKHKYAEMFPSGFRFKIGQPVETVVEEPVASPAQPDAEVSLEPVAEVKAKRKTRRGGGGQK
jgi:hypothetical protein